MSESSGTKRRSEFGGRYRHSCKKVVDNIDITYDQTRLLSLLKDSRSGPPRKYLASKKKLPSRDDLISVSVVLQPWERHAVVDGIIKQPKDLKGAIEALMSQVATQMKKSSRMGQVATQMKKRRDVKGAIKGLMGQVAAQMLKSKEMKGVIKGLMEQVAAPMEQM